MKICIDTNAYSSLKRGNNNVLQILENSSRIIVPTIVIGELLAGFNIGSKYKENSTELQVFLKEYGVELKAPDCSIAECYGRIISELRHKGTPIPTNGIWIAATSIETSSRLLSNCKAFAITSANIFYIQIQCMRANLISPHQSFKEYRFLSCLKFLKIMIDLMMITRRKGLRLQGVLPCP